MEVLILSEFICNACLHYIETATKQCPHCQTELIFSGDQKNITDELIPNCLIHRYDGSDLLEKGRMIKEGKVNNKVVLKLKDFTRPLSIPKNKIYAFDPSILSSIDALRQERKEVMEHYDFLIGEYWDRLEPILDEKDSTL